MYATKPAKQKLKPNNNQTKSKKTKQSSSPFTKRSIHITKKLNMTKQQQSTQISSLLPSIQPQRSKQQFTSTTKIPLSPLTRKITTMSQDDNQDNKNIDIATLGCGCYWGVENYMRKKFGDGIVDIKVGFMGGDVENPTYKQVCGGDTNHVEVAQIHFDTKKVTFNDIIKFAFTIHDPTTVNRQGNDMGTQYASVMFYTNDEQKKIIQDVRDKLQIALNNNKVDFKRGKYENDEIVTQLRPMQQFYSAHDEHQMYLIKNPGGYCNHSIRFTWDPTWD